MTDALIVVRLHSESECFRAREYRVAGRPLVTDVPLLALAAFGRDSPTPGPRDAWPERTGDLDAEGPATTHLVFRGRGWIGGAQRVVEYRAGPLGCRLAVAGGGEYWIASDGSRIERLVPEPEGQASLGIETVLGPALVLALALQGPFCLHASSAAFGQRAIAFLGESQSGKSTLAAHLGGEGGPAWQRLADDVLPVAAVGGGPVALPHFPQLKLSPEEQPAPDGPEQLPLAAVYILDAPEGGGGVDAGSAAASAASTVASSDSEGHTAVAIHPLGTRQAMLALVRHTVASRLFDGALAARHMAFCTEVAAAVPVRRLAYPRRRALLPRVRAAIEADLQVE